MVTELRKALDVLENLPPGRKGKCAGCESLRAVNKRLKEVCFEALVVLSDGPSVDPHKAPPHLVEYYSRWEKAKQQLREVVHGKQALSGGEAPIEGPGPEVVGCGEVEGVKLIEVVYGECPDACRGDLVIYRAGVAVYHTPPGAFKSTGNIRIEDCGEYIDEGNLVWDNEEEEQRFLEWAKTQPEHEEILVKAKEALAAVMVCCGSCI